MEVLSYAKVGPPAEAQVDKAPVYDNDQELQEESSMTPTDWEVKQQFKEMRTKKRQKEGKASVTIPMEDEQVNLIIVAIIVVTTTTENQLRKHSTKRFTEVKSQLTYWLMWYWRERQRKNCFREWDISV